MFFFVGEGGENLTVFPIATVFSTSFPVKRDIYFIAIINLNLPFLKKNATSVFKNKIQS